MRRRRTDVQRFHIDSDRVQHALPCDGVIAVADADDLVSGLGEAAHEVGDALLVPAVDREADEENPAAALPAVRGDLVQREGRRGDEGELGVLLGHRPQSGSGRQDAVDRTGGDDQVGLCPWFSPCPFGWSCLMDSEHRRSHL